MHSFLHKQENQQECIACQTSYIVKLIQIECSDFAVIRKLLYNTNNLRDTFQNIYRYNIFFLPKRKGIIP